MKPNDLDRCSNALFFVRRRFSWMFADLRMLLEEQSSTSESKMAAGAAAVRMLQTVSSFRHRDASRGPAYFHGVTSLAHSDFEPRKKEAAETSRLHDGSSSHRFPVFYPGIVGGHEGAPAVLPGALPPGFPAIQNSRCSRFSGRVLRDADQHEGTEGPFGFCIFGAGRALNVSPGSVFGNFP